MTDTARLNALLRRLENPAAAIVSVTRFEAKELAAHVRLLHRERDHVPTAIDFAGLAVETVIEIRNAKRAALAALLENEIARAFCADEIKRLRAEVEAATVYVSGDDEPTQAEG